MKVLSDSGHVACRRSGRTRSSEVARSNLAVTTRPKSRKSSTRYEKSVNWHDVLRRDDNATTPVPGSRNVVRGQEGEA